MGRERDLRQRRGGRPTTARPRGRRRLAPSCHHAWARRVPSRADDQEPRASTPRVRVSSPVTREFCLPGDELPAVVAANPTLPRLSSGGARSQSGHNRDQVVTFSFVEPPDGDGPPGDRVGLERPLRNGCGNEIDRAPTGCQGGEQELPSLLLWCSPSACRRGSGSVAPPVGAVQRQELLRRTSSSTPNACWPTELRTSRTRVQVETSAFGARTNPSPPAFRAAQSKCQKLLPRDGGLPRSGQPPSAQGGSDAEDRSVHASARHLRLPRLEHIAPVPLPRPEHIAPVPSHRRRPRDQRSRRCDPGIPELGRSAVAAFTRPAAACGLALTNQ